MYQLNIKIINIYEENHKIFIYDSLRVTLSYADFNKKNIVLLVILL